MKVLEKQILIKDKKIVLRSCESSDAQVFLDFFHLVSGESGNMIRYPEEITITCEKEAIVLQNILDTKNQWMIGAFDGERMIGNISFGSIGDRMKIKHRASFGITIIKEYWNCGLGSILIQEMFDILNEFGFEQVELEVTSINENGIHLYKKMGFVECGRMPHGFKLKNGQYIDLISMIKFLGN